MSENLDLVRSIHADWSANDYSSGEWAHPEIEFVVADGPSLGSWTGLAEMANALRDMLTAWEGVRLEAEDYPISTTSASSCSTATAGAARRAGWRSDRLRAGLISFTYAMARSQSSSATSTATGLWPT